MGEAGVPALTAPPPLLLSGLGPSQPRTPPFLALLIVLPSRQRGQRLSRGESVSPLRSRAEVTPLYHTGACAQSCLSSPPPGPWLPNPTPCPPVRAPWPPSSCCQPCLEGPRRPGRRGAGDPHICHTWLLLGPLVLPAPTRVTATQCRLQESGVGPHSSLFLGPQAPGRHLESTGGREAACRATQGVTGTVLGPVFGGCGDSGQHCP